MYRKLMALVLCLTLVAGMIPNAWAFDREYKGEYSQSVDQCNHTLRVNTMDVNYVRPAYSGYLIGITPQRVADTFAYLDEMYVQKYPEAALTVYTGTEQDRADILRLAEEITKGCRTDREKANAVDAWLQKNVVYELHGSAYASDTMYRLEGNCLSYANLMQFLLRSLGIPAVVGDGWRGDMKTNTVDLFNYDGHAWCFVLLDGEWVLYDPLWLSGGTNDRDYMAEWIYFDTVEFVCPASDGDNLPPEAYDKPKAYYTDGKVYAWSEYYQDTLGVLTSFVNNQAYCYVTNQCEEGGSQDGWYVLDGGCDKDAMERGQLYSNCWMSYGDYASDGALMLTYVFPNGVMADGYETSYEGTNRLMYGNNSWPILADRADYTITDGKFTLKTGYSGPFLDYSWQDGFKSPDEEYVIVWENRNEEIATVDENGIITCHAEGYAEFLTYLARVETDGSLSYMSTNIIQVIVSSEERTCPSDAGSSGNETISGVCGENLTWELSEDGVLTISGTGAMYDYEAAVEPAAVTVLSTRGQAPWYASKSDIREIVIGEEVTSIGANAFTGCDAVETVTIPASVETIGQSAFAECTGLTEIVFEGDAPEIGESAFASVEAEVTYPEDNETWNEEVIGNYGGELTWPEEEEQEEYFTQWISATTSLNGTIDLNIYIAMSENLLDEEDAFVRFIRNGVIVDVPVSEGVEAEKRGQICYRYSCEIFAKQVADTITIQVMNADGAISDVLEYSVMRYCVNQIKNSQDAELVKLCKALLNYATAAQIYFNHNPENPANASLSDADKVLPDVDASAYKFNVVGAEPGIKPRSATLNLESEVAIRVYFIVEEGYDISDFTFTIDGVKVPVQQNEKGYYIESEGIAAKELDDMHKFTVGGLTVNYGALSYVNSKAGGSNVNEANLAKALCAYYVAAEALLG